MRRGGGGNLGGRGGGRRAAGVSELLAQALYSGLLQGGKSADRFAIEIAKSLKLQAEMLEQMAGGLLFFRLCPLQQLNALLDPSGETLLQHRIVQQR